MTYKTTHQVVPRCIDLFSGAGGLTLGFCRAGGLPLAAVDNDADSVATYAAMFPVCKHVHCGDIEAWERPLFRDVDVVIGGPPCQGFSLARGLRFVDDPRNHLYRWFVELVAEVQPKWFVMENVPGITSIGGGVILEQINEDFRDAGYTVDHRVINMADFGVPQSRRRAIFVGNRLGVEFEWPEPTHVRHVVTDELGRNPAVTIHDALSDLPWPLGGYFAHRANSQMRGPRNRSVDTDVAFTLRVRGDEFAMCEHPATSAFVPGPVPDVEFGYGPASNEFQRTMRESPPSWIVQSSPSVPILTEPVGRLVGTRKLALREQARLQTFPDWFQFTGRPYSQARQIGNAVPPVFAQALFEKILLQSTKPKDVQRLARAGAQAGPERLVAVSLDVD